MTVKQTETQHPRMKREKKTIEAMVHFYCKAKHDTHGELYTKCAEFQAYAFMRLDKCPFKEKKNQLRQMHRPLLPT